MNRTEKTGCPTQPVLLGAIPKKKDDGTRKVEGFFVGGGRGGKGFISKIYRGKTPGGTLGARSAVAPTVPSDSTDKPPVSLLWFTKENIANLSEDKMVKPLSHNGRFDPVRLATVLFLPDGYPMVKKIVERIPKHRLIKLFGESRASSDDFMDLLFEKKFLEKVVEESPTIEEMKEYLRVKCGFSPEDLQNEEVDWRLTSLAQTGVNVYADEREREKFEKKLRDVVDSIFAKLPRPNKRNQACWDNVGKSITLKIHGKKKAKRRAELTRRFPVLDHVLPRN